MRWIAVCVLAAVAAAAMAHTEEDGSAEAAEDAGALVAQDEAPVVDGAVAEGEYGLSMQYDGMTIGLALVGDTLYVAAAATTTGWVGVGFASDRMDGARILFSFVDAEGQVFFAEQEGSDHKHHDVTDTVATAHAVGEADGVTTLEAALPAAFVRDTADEAGHLPDDHGVRPPRLGAGRAPVLQEHRTDLRLIVTEPRATVVARYAPRSADPRRQSHVASAASSSPT